MKPSKKPRTSQAVKTAPVAKKLDLFSMNLPVSEPVFLISLFILAVALKFVCLWQYASFPDFANPVGDSENYLIQARAILAHGRLFGDTVPFQTPLYPIFLAGLLAISRQSLFFVRLVQISMGAANCLLVYFLAKKILANGRLLPAVAGVLTALYGLLTFFDVDILGISPAIFALNISLLLTIKARENLKIRWAAAAGIFLGFAILERANLLLFLPAVLWYLASGFSLHFSRLREWSWKPVAGFLAAVFLMILPITVNNYLISRDFVLISSNAGINLFLGNNPEADGTFRMPKKISGLTNYGMAQSMVTVAEDEIGKKLKPSEVSRYWSRRAWRFLLTEPSAVLALYGRKTKMMLSQVEYPNHLSFDFMKVEVMPFLKTLFVGFGWIAPWALVGLWASYRRRWNDSFKLILVFLGVYSLSVMIFFITDRYRLPIVPLLIILSVAGMASVVQWLWQRQWQTLGWAMVILLLAFWVAYLPIPQRLAYSHTRTALGDRYADRAEANPQSADEDYRQAILQYKQASHRITPRPTNGWPKRMKPSAIFPDVSG
jgi:4-amino-4-deoxy-L-arabinose transferase-like glycosyltransferase